jgi:hypothetical protein
MLHWCGSALSSAFCLQGGTVYATLMYVGTARCFTLHCGCSVLSIACMQGSTVYATLMYILVAFIGLSLCGCGWICYAFTRNRFVPNKW